MFGTSSHFLKLRRPHELIVRNRRFFKRFDKSKSLADYDFVVYDTELTGLDPRRDEIIAIGAVKVRNLQIDLAQTFHYYVRPERLNPTKATLVHKITPEQLTEAPPLTEVLPKFLGFIGTDLLVGHFVGIDMSFLNQATRKVYRGRIANPALDTRRMAQIYRRIILGFYYENSTSTPTSYQLKSLSNEFNLPFFEAHDALEDALQTAYLFLYLVKKLHSAGVLSLRDLHQAGRGINWATL